MAEKLNEEKRARLLRADEIECRVGTANAKGFSLLLYKDARVDMNILDETVGSLNWQREHKEIKGNLYCGVSIWDEKKQQWNTKWDCGVESNTEKEKGEASDSFKRACFNVLGGIGRELYTAPFIWINGNTQDKNGRYVPTLTDIEVKYIDYDENRNIKALLIVSGESILFKWGKIDSQVYKTSKSDIKKDNVEVKQIVEKETKTQEKAPQKAQEPVKEQEQAKQITLDEAKKCKTPKGALLNNLTYDQLKVISINNKYDSYIRECAKILMDELETMAFVEETDGDLDF